MIPNTDYKSMVETPEHMLSDIIFWLKQKTPEDKEVAKIIHRHLCENILEWKVQREHGCANQKQSLRQNIKTDRVIPAWSPDIVVLSKSKRTEAPLMLLSQVIEIY